jgi:hypothetical protein
LEIYYYFYYILYFLVKLFKSSPWFKYHGWEARRERRRGEGEEEEGHFLSSILIQSLGIAMLKATFWYFLGKYFANHRKPSLGHFLAVISHPVPRSRREWRQVRKTLADWNYCTETCHTYSYIPLATAQLST